MKKPVIRGEHVHYCDGCDRQTKCRNECVAYKTRAENGGVAVGFSSDTCVHCDPPGDPSAARQRRRPLKNRSLSEYLPNLVEFPKALKRGDRICDAELLVLEVRALRSTCLLAGRERRLYVAVHEKGRHGSMLTHFCDLSGRQREWAGYPSQRTDAPKGGA